MCDGPVCAHVYEVWPMVVVLMCVWGWVGKDLKMENRANIVTYTLMPKLINVLQYMHMLLIGHFVHNALLLLLRYLRFYS